MSKKTFKKGEREMTTKELFQMCEERCAESEAKFPRQVGHSYTNKSNNHIGDVISFFNDRNADELLSVNLIVEGEAEPFCTALMDHEMVEKVLEVGITKILAEHVGMAHGIKHITFNHPATIVQFLDGDKVVVKVENKDDYFPATGVAWAIAKKLFGSTTKFMEFVKDEYGREEHNQLECWKDFLKAIDDGSIKWEVINDGCINGGIKGDCSCGQRR